MARNETAATRINGARRAESFSEKYGVLIDYVSSIIEENGILGVSIRNINAAIKQCRSGEDADIRELYPRVVDILCEKRPAIRRFFPEKIPKKLLKSQLKKEKDAVDPFEKALQELKNYTEVNGTLRNPDALKGKVDTTTAEIVAKIYEVIDVSPNIPHVDLFREYYFNGTGAETLARIFDNKNRRVMRESLEKTGRAIKKILSEMNPQKTEGEADPVNANETNS